MVRPVQAAPYRHHRLRGRNKLGSAPYGSDGVDDCDGVFIDRGDSLNHRPTPPPQSEVVPVAHISDHNVVKPKLTTHTVIPLIHRRGMFGDRSDLRVCKNDRDVLAPRSGDGSVDVIRERGSHSPAVANLAGDGVDRGNNVVQTVRAGSPSAERRLNRCHVQNDV